MAYTKPGKGKVKIGKFSGLRKLMRAGRRGVIPSERMFIIQTAERKAASRLLRRMSEKQRGKNETLEHHTL